MKNNYFKISITFIYLFITTILQAQTGNIQGFIKTKDDKPAMYVSVQLKELKKGTTTAEDGSYFFKNIQPGKYTVIISFIGLQTIEKQIEVISEQIQYIDFSIVENSTQLTEVVITATKTINEKVTAIGKIPVKAMDLPQSITVIGKDVLDRQQTLRLSDALMNVTGVYLYGTAGGYQEEIGGRGFAFNSSNTFKNGVRYNNSTMPDMTGIEKIEILKGSSAILFGNVAAGGILNLITKKPLFENGGKISFRTGSYNLYKPALDIYGAINNSKHVAYRINTASETAHSFRNQVKSNRFYINPSLLINAGKKTEILLEGDYLKDNRTADFGIPAINYEIAKLPRNTSIGTPWAYYNSEQKTATATITHKINNNWQVKNITSYQNFNSDLFATVRPNNNNNTVKANGNWVRGLQQTINEEDYYINQLEIAGNVKTGKIKHVILVGADADKYNTNATANTYVNAAANNKNIYDSINVFDANKYKQRTDIPTMTGVTTTYNPIKRYGIYLQDLISLTEKIKLLAGVRYSNQTSGGGFIDSLAKAKITKNISTKDDAFTPRLGLVYQPLKTISIFSSYANSFTLNTGVNIYGQALKPSFINQYEVGVKTELFKKILSANVVVYKIVNSNLAQISLNDEANPSQNANIKELAGEVTSKGLEVDIATKYFYGIQVIAGYSFNETKYTKSNTYIEGSKLKYNPSHTANASLYYNFNNRSILKGFNAGLVAYYFGERFAGRSTRIQVINDKYKLIPLSAYTQLDASLGYTLKNVSVILKITNLFNKLNYNVHDDNSINPIAPRQLAGTIAYKF